MLDINKEKKVFKVFIGIGTNKGDRKKNIQIALNKLNKHKAIRIIKVSKMLKNPPQEGIKTGYFLNGAIKILTTLRPEELLKYCLKIEKHLGRIRSQELKVCKKINKPRTIDIDILFYGNKIIRNKNLTIPHPRLHKRYFVLIPLMELDKNLIHPGFKKSIYDLHTDLNKTIKIPA